MPKKEANILDNIDASIERATAVVGIMFDSSPVLAAEIFPEETLEEWRIRALAHKMIDYATQSTELDEEVASNDTIADALIALAPGNYARGSRRQNKARKAVSEWFDLEHTGKRVIGATLMSVVDHHHQRTVQQSGELRNKLANSEEGGPNYLFTTSNGLQLFRLETKLHLQQESAATGHCVGTGTFYAERLAKGRDYFFSLRDPSVDDRDSFAYTTIQFDTEEQSVRQIRGRFNKAVRIDTPHLPDVAEALIHIRDNIPGVDPEKFSIQDLVYQTIEDTNLETITSAVNNISRNDIVKLFRDLKRVIPINVHITEAFDPDILETLPAELDAFDIRKFVFDTADEEVLAKIIEKLGFVVGDVEFPQLESAEGLKGLESIRGHASFPKLKTSEGLEELAEILGHATFPELTDASGLVSLRHIGGDAFFGELTQAAGLDRLERVGGSIKFAALLSSKGLERLRIVPGDASLPSLTSALGLTGLEEVSGRMFCGSLTSSAGLSSLKRIGKGAHFMQLEEAADLTALESIGARAHFEALVSAVGLERLTHIGGRAYLQSLKSSEGLQNVESIGSYVYADSMDELERRALRKRIVSNRKQRKRQ